jgi:hypothetical protein
MHFRALFELYKKIKLKNNNTAHRSWRIFAGLPLEIKSV